MTQKENRQKKKKKSYHHGNVKINNRKHKQDYQYRISLKIHIIVGIQGICQRTYLSTQNSIIFYAKRNSVRKVVFDMPTNVGPTYGYSPLNMHEHSPRLFRGDYSLYIRAKLTSAVNHRGSYIAFCSVYQKDELIC